MNNPLISVIIPVYRVEKYLCTCLDSVLNQSYTNWEMILVDDGSPDRSGEICDEYAERDQRITVVHKQNGGQSSARNAALDLPPRGEFVTFLDSDDFWHEDYLSCLLNLQRKYNADIVQCGFIRGTDTIFPDICLKECIYVLDRHEVFLKEFSNVIMPAKIYRSNLFEGIRMPVGLYNEDDWTAWKLYYKAESIVITNKMLYYYTANPDSTMAKLGKKPDLRYINAYKERIGFFLQTGEKDLEHCSRLQLCKALVLTYRNDQLSREEQKQIKSKFEENWNELKYSQHIRMKYKILFCLFDIMPLHTSKLAAKIHSKK